MPFSPRQFLFWGLTDIIKKKNNYYQSYNCGLTTLSTLVAKKKKPKNNNNHPRQHRPPKKPESQFEKVGIVECIGKNRKVNATLKESPSDFHVHEIDQNGEIVRLTYLGIPPKTDHVLTKRGRFYTHCTLYKDGVSGTEVIESLAKKLRIDATCIRWAGMMEKNAITCQKISVRDVPAWDLMQVSKRSSTFKLGNYSYTSYPISTGEFKGSQYEILLKDIKLGPTLASTTIAAATIESGINSLREHGFINYFSLERFGARQISNLEVGTAALKQNWEEVIDILLRVSRTYPDEIRNAKAIWWRTHDPIQVAKKFPKVDRHPDISSTDYSVLWALGRLGRQWTRGEREKDLSFVFESVPENLRDLFFQAFQALLWNNLITFRIQKFGLQPIPGDTVDAGSPHETTYDADDVRTWGLSKLKVLTQDDLNNSGGKYSIYNVMLTVPGHGVPVYSIPQVQKLYEKLLKKHGLTPDCFSKFRPESIAPVGFHRHLIVRPRKVDFRIVRYNEDEYKRNDADEDEDEDADGQVERPKLIMSDLDRLVLREVKRDSGHDQNKDDDDGDDSISLRSRNISPRRRRGLRGSKSSDSDKFCAIVEFSLPRSTYATSALREIINLPEGNPWIDKKKEVKNIRK